MAEPRIVTFTTDFGLSEPFVGIMHGVVLNIHPEATIVDVCHSIASYDVQEGAWTIAQAYHYFPPGTVHVVVVDPGVGGARRPILAETEDYLFVAPDNGVLTLVEMREPKFAVRHITAERYFVQPVSQTFHGRDIFAPVAGWLSDGVAAEEFGPKVNEWVRLSLPVVERSGAKRLCGEVLKVDKFGNLITNVATRDVPSLLAESPPAVSIRIAGRTIRRVCQSYAEGSEGALFAILGSSGYLEIAARQDSAAARLGAAAGTAVEIVFED